jgi:23S rRNA pseudouridine1911/1915/1917 synthase
VKRRTFQAAGALSRLPLAEALAQELGLSAAEARARVEAGGVYLAGKRCRDPRASLARAPVVMVVLEEGGQSALAAAPPPPALRVLLEDEALIAVDKAPGVTAQPTEGRVGESLVDRVSAHLGYAAGLVHRLDRETSGVTVFGKTPAATSALAAQFREGHAKKRYLAACGPGLAPRGTVDLPLSKDPARPGRYRATRAANGVPALTHYETLHAGSDFCLVLLLPQTGRTHQLRAHLTALGTPILGDARYGGAREAGGVAAPRCLLHAQVLELAHPVSGAPLRLVAPVPDDLARFFLAAHAALPG